MASDTDSEDQINPILESLERVLAPLGPERLREVMGWTREYLATTPLTSYLCAQGEPGDVEWHAPDAEHPKAWTSAKVYEFRIGEPNPLDPDNTVFAIFHWYIQGIFVVYSFKAGLLDDGGALGIFTRDQVFRPRMASGPVTLDALYADLDYHTHASPWDDDDPDDDERPAAPNGSRPALIGPRTLP